MAVSQNVLFYGSPPDDNEFDHPPGGHITRTLRKSLVSSGWRVADMENWRDCGWSIKCNQADSSLQIAVAQVEEGKWLLQVSPTYSPGLLGRIFQKPPSANSEQCLLLAKSVHRVLSSENTFSGFLWCWDNFPSEQQASSEPVAHNETS